MLMHRQPPAGTGGKVTLASGSRVLVVGAGIAGLAARNRSASSGGRGPSSVRPLYREQHYQRCVLVGAARDNGARRP